MVDQFETAQSQSASKGKKRREVSRYVFPYYDLDTSIEVAKALHDRAGGKASIAHLASYLGHKDEFSGSFRAKVWGAQLLGLVRIEGRTVSITPLGEQLASARTGVQRDKRLAEAFLNVPLFREVYRRYENSTLPSTRDGLKKALQDTFGVSPRLVSSALKALEASAEQAGFKREDPNRLIHPVPIGLIEADISLEAEAREEKMIDAGALGGEMAPEVVIPKGIHLAISGFLLELPSKGGRWTEGERQRWIDAFTAMIKALYPIEDEK